MKPDVSRGIKGLGFAVGIFVLWAGCLVMNLSWPVSDRPLLWTIVGILIQTLLYTGLFITAHDAIHNTIWPGKPGLNRWIGRVILFLYALFPYGKIRRLHFQHHKTPGRPDDPDYHGGEHRGFFAWYAHFMLHYLTWWQILGMALIFNGLNHLVGLAAPDVILFWVAPSLLSTLQLFTFGTYLPHREPPGGYTNDHHAASNNYPVWLSFLTCYHFGYHLEHHKYPSTPWWQLPHRRKQLA